jgi:hypothetical protein
MTSLEAHLVLALELKRLLLSGLSSEATTSSSEFLGDPVEANHTSGLSMTDGSLMEPVYYLEQNFASYALDSTASIGGGPGPWMSTQKAAELVEESLL